MCARSSRVEWQGTVLMQRKRTGWEDHCSQTRSGVTGTARLVLVYLCKGSQVWYLQLYWNPNLGKTTSLKSGKMSKRPNLLAVLFVNCFQARGYRHIQNTPFEAPFIQWIAQSEENRFCLYTCLVWAAQGQDSPTRHGAPRLPPEVQLSPGFHPAPREQ